MVFASASIPHVIVIKLFQQLQDLERGEVDMGCAEGVYTFNELCRYFSFLLIIIILT